MEEGRAVGEEREGQEEPSQKQNNPGDSNTKLVGTNKPDPKKPNHTPLEVRSKKSSEDYVLILDIPGKHIEYRED